MYVFTKYIYQCHVVNYAQEAKHLTSTMNVI